LEATLPETDDVPGYAMFVLHQVSAKIVAGFTEGGILDINGNRIGSWQLEGR
jgi:hypothetical protein